MKAIALEARSRALAVLLFKYLSCASASRVLALDNEVSLRFALPSEYNDPYELFLQPDRPLESDEERAFVQFFLGDLTHFPIACFSRRPESVVMWAHYCQEGTGIVLAFDEDALANRFPILYAKDVEYSDEPALLSSDNVKWATTTWKRRHALWLINEAYGTAYFTKRADWAYEHERRLVVDADQLDRLHERDFLGRFPPNVLRYIIVGPKSPDDLVALCQTRANSFSVPLLRFSIGRRSYDPYFVARDGAPLVWHDGSFVEAENVCSECGEPAVLNDGEACGWCDITDAHAADVASHSLLTATIGMGLERLEVNFNGAEVKGYRIKGKRAKRST